MTTSSNNDNNNNNHSHNNGGEETTTHNDEDHHHHHEHHHNNKHVIEQERVKNVAKKETNFMRLSKTMLLITIILATIGVSIGTYKLLTSEENDDFKENFLLFTNTVANAEQFHAQNMYQAMETCAESITSASKTNNETFPFVTVDQFEIVGAATREQSGIEMLFWEPVVDENEKELWLKYSAEHQTWVNQSRALAERNREGLAPLEYIYSSIPSIIWDRDEELTVRPTVAEAPYMPVWQVSPPPFHPGFVNFNLPTFPGNKEQLEATGEQRVPIIARAIYLGRLGIVAQNPADHDAYHDGFVDWTKPVDEEYSAFNNPHSLITQPVFKEPYDPTSDVVGYVMGVVPWDKYVTNLLPSGVKGITFVIENSCGQIFIYELDGSRATFLGDGDMHDTQYDNMKIEIPFTRKKGSSNELEENLKGSCKYKFVLYPTSNFEQEYNTNVPVLMTITVACIFIVMTIMFLFYDWFVKRRNKKILSEAGKAGAIVASMFPSTVRDRLFAVNDEHNNNNKLSSLDQNNAASKATTSLLQDFMEDGNQGEVNKDEEILTSKPIADLFPNTTILFADIAGFTQWSSSREPAAVFTLLETLYRAFDDIAKRRGVFKVETIGDCYVAVCGLPQPRKNHAVVMARFANDIRNKFKYLTKKLESTLGPETGTLDIRVGIHIGQVTAGVLRGENARFQLFGDTMNTASRMESNSIRDHIQVSQEMADLLISAGKSHWLTAREEKIKAKGKGELQTYWLDIDKTNNCVIGSSVRSMSIEGSDDHRVSDEAEEEQQNHNDSSNRTSHINDVSKNQIIYDDVTSKQQTEQEQNNSSSPGFNEIDRQSYHYAHAQFDC